MLNDIFYKNWIYFQNKKFTGGSDTSLQAPLLCGVKKTAGFSRWFLNSAALTHII